MSCVIQYSLLGLSEVLLRSDSIFDGSKNNTLIQKEMVEIRRLRRLTEDILDITKIEGRTLKLKKQNFIVVRTIEEMTQSQSPTIPSNNDENFPPAISFVMLAELSPSVVIPSSPYHKQLLCHLQKCQHRHQQMCC